VRLDVVSLNSVQTAMVHTLGWCMATVILDRLCGSSHHGLRQDAITLGTMLRSFKGPGEAWPRALELLELARGRAESFVPLRCWNALLSLEPSWRKVLMLRRHLHGGDEISANSLISAGSWSLAAGTLRRMPAERLIPDEISYNAAMTAQVQRGGSWSMAFLWLATMKTGTVSPSVISFNSAINALSFQNSWSLFLASLQLLHGAGLVPSAVTFNTGLALCEKQPKPWSWLRAMLMFSSIRQSCRCDAISFATFISSSRWIFALTLLQAAGAEGVQPTSAGLVALVAAVGESRLNWQRSLWLYHMPGAATVLSRLAACEACESNAAVLSALPPLLEQTARNALPKR